MFGGVSSSSYCLELPRYFVVALPGPSTNQYCANQLISLVFRILLANTGFLMTRIIIARGFYLEKEQHFIMNACKVHIN